MHYKKYKSILSPHNGMNIYRGCTHGCIYCDSRSVCYQMDHDFEDIEVKTNAPEMLEAELLKKRKKCVIGTGAMCDPYMHCEKELENTRKCLQIIEKYGFGLAVQTKSTLVLRDLDLLKRINERSKCVVQITLTTFDEELCRILEPDVSTTKERVNALKILHDNGIPTVVWLTPILPFLNDTEENIRGIFHYCLESGVWGIINFGMGVTLRDGDKEYFYKKLDEHFPGMKKKYILKYSNSYEVLSDNNDRLMKIFYEECNKNGIVCNNNEIFAFMREYVDKTKPEQMTMF